jgi:DNA-binding transcriptional ArsR family regulator
MSRRDDSPPPQHPEQSPHSGSAKSQPATSDHAAYEFDEVLLSPARLAIVSALLAASEMDFVALRNLLSLTAGNLSVHGSRLESAGYIRIDKSFVGKMPRTTFRLTPTGRSALLRHVECLNQIVQSRTSPEGR